MRKSIVIAALFLLLVFSLSAEIRILSSSESHLSLEYELDEYELSETTYKSNIYQRILTDGIGSMKPGAPDLPTSALWFAHPKETGTMLNVDAQQSDIYSVKKLMAVPQPAPELKDSPEIEISFDDEIYDTNKYYPGFPANIEKESDFRGIPAAVIRFYPFQYNPVTGELQVYKTIRVDLDFTGSAEALPANVNVEHLRKKLCNYAVNADVVMDYQETLESVRDDYRNTGGELLIFSPEEFIEPALQLKSWKERKGIVTKVISLTECGNTPFSISSCIQEHYDNYSPAPEYIMLFGDAEFIPPWYVHQDPYSGTMLGTDVYYGDLEMEFDFLLDFAVGRLPVDTFEDAQRMVENIINYESQPPVSASFYENVAVAGAFQDGSNGDPPDTYANRRFAKTSEDIRNYLYEQNYNPQRLYAEYNGYNGNPIYPTYWNQNYYIFENDIPGGEIPEEIQKPQFPWNYNAADVSSAVNDGTFLLTHRDHGGRTGWGEPDYDNNDVAALSNGENLPVVWTVNCLTGYFDNETDDPGAGTGENSECFVEQWFRNPNGGAIGAVGSTRVSYSGNNDRFVWGLMDAIWPSFLEWCGVDYPTNNPVYRMGDVVDYAKTYLSLNVFFDDYLLITFEEFEWFGDPTLEIWTAQPQEILVSHESSFEYGAEEFSVDAGIMGAVCTLYNGEDVIAAAISGLDCIANLNIGEFSITEELILTVSYPQTQPYITDITVLPPDNGFLQLQSVAINDIDGNQNGQPDFGESISLNIALDNIGNQSVTDFVITLETENEYVELIDDEYSFSGNIIPQQTIELTDIFSIDIASDCPNQTVVELVFSIEEFSFTTVLNINAPQLISGYFSIDDVNGNNNGAADPGESVTFNLPVQNTGGIYAENVSVMLLSYDPFLSIEPAEIVIDSLGDETDMLQFTGIVSVNAPLDTDYQIQAFINSGEYSFDRLMTGNYGLAVEDFESEDFSVFDWQISGTVGWFIDTDAASGSFSARTDYMGVNNWTELAVSGFLPEDDIISFYRKLYADTSLPDNDGGMLYFMIDDEEIAAWGANRPWQRMEFEVPAGPHTFRWIFEKDYDPTLGEDGAWIDRIEFPNMSPPPPPNLEFDAAEINLILEQGEEYETAIQFTNSGAGSIEYYLYFAEQIRDLNDSRVVINTYQYYPGQTTGWLLQLQNNSTTGEGITNLELEFPDEVNVNVATPLSGALLGSFTPDITSGSGITINWNGETPEGNGFLLPGETAQGAVNVSINEAAPLNIILNAQLSGDQGSITDQEIQLGNLSNGWLTLDNNNGIVVFGQYDEVALNFNTDDLDIATYQQDLLICDNLGNQTVIPITLEITASGVNNEVINNVSQINSVYPNPFNPQTFIDFSLQKDEYLELIIYNVKGQKVDTLLDEDLKAGNHQIIWNAENQPSGIYFLKMISDSCRDTKKILLLK